MRVLWRPSKLCTWFIFFPHNLLSLDNSSSSCLTSALWDIKYTLILQNCLLGGRGEVERGPFGAWKRDLLGHGSRVGTVTSVLNETENHRVYLATIMGPFSAFCLYPPLDNPGFCSGIFMKLFKGIMAPNFPHMVLVFAEQCHTNTWSGRMDSSNADT